MKQYHELIKDILANGEIRDDRTGVGTQSVFGRTVKFDLSQGFPAVTTKKLAWRAVVGELLWFLEGSSDERRLAEITHGTREGVTTIWTPNALAPYWKDRAEFEGDLGRIYGVQWRSWRSPISTDKEVGIKVVDQISELVVGLKSDPYSRRHVLSAWNPGEFDAMALPPCHIMCQFYVDKDNKLSCQMYQRSQDVFLGAPFNYASYALLTHMLAQVCGYGVGSLTVVSGDTHLYLNHIEQAKELITRQEFPQPQLWLNPNVKNIFEFGMDDCRLINYQHHDTIKAQMAV